MAAVDGRWNTVVKSPLGDQSTVLTVKSDGARWSGSQSGAMGSIDIPEGTVEGDTLRWVVSVTVPMPLTLSCEAKVDGDTLAGTVGVGAFGSFPRTGTRA